MKVGILVTCYNRHEYLEQCLWSLERVDLPENSIIMLADDCSTNPETKLIFTDFTHKTAPIQREIAVTNMGIKKILNHCYDTLFGLFECDIVINFDSDAIIHPDCVNELIRLYKPKTLLTGFHSTNKNRDGSERHKILSTEGELFFKQSVGGINFCIDKYAYEHYVKPALEMHIGNWDHQSCIKAGGAYCLKKSLVQHIGFDSSLNHNEQPDVADTFSYYDLPNVTLIAIDSNKERLLEPLKKCTEYLNFGDIQVLSPPLNSKQAYSEFCIKELYKHINTSHLLIFQHDGYVNNWKAWDESWLEYDYIGAPWHYQDGMEVGNGGFSLRSRLLMEILATDPYIQIMHPEDHHICRTYRPYLENKYGIKFAPVEVAEKFSFEGYLQPNKILKDQFGVHGKNPRKEIQVNKPLRSEKYVFNQFLSLGDILFLVPMARELMKEGNQVIWPIDNKYLSIKKHFPDINFVSKDEIKIPYEFRGRVATPYGILLPYRFANELLGLSLKHCMTAKYRLYGHDYNIWRSLYWQRDKVAEKRLKQLVGASGNYQVINRFFGHEASMRITPNPNPKLEIVEMRPIEGFTLIDWLGVIEGAKELHVSNSSLNYIIELSTLPMPVYVYKRGIWGENGFEYTRELWQNKCWRFVE